MAEQESNGFKIEVIPPEDMRDVEGFLPELNGFTLWHMQSICTYCNLPLAGDVLVLQKVARSGLSFMCMDCVKRLFLKVTA